jgi:glycosyltransferase involved in cell wall biosynthesis
MPDPPPAPRQVSIGMPVYNGERFVARAIESLLAQTYTDFELVISDNASTDGTQRICEAFALRDPRIRYVRHAENRGPIFNFSFVLKQARGEYFMWAADDDERNASYLEVLHARMRPSVALAFGRVETIDARSDVIRLYPRYRYTGGRFGRAVRYFFDRDQNGKACLIYGLFRTELLREIPLRHYFGCSYGFDMHYVFDLLQRGDVVIDDRAVFRPRIYEREPERVPETAFDAARSPWHKAFLVVDRVLLLRALRCNATFVLIDQPFAARLTIAALLPIKYLRDLVINLAKLPGVMVRGLCAVRVHAAPHRSRTAKSSGNSAREQ